MELTEADLPGEHALAVGDELVVRLEENRTTGYRWRPDALPDGIAVVDDAFESPSPGRPGQGGVRRFTLRPTAAGDHRVTLALKRSWDQAAPERTVEFTLHAG